MKAFEMSGVKLAVCFGTGKLGQCLLSMLRIPLSRRDCILPCIRGYLVQVALRVYGYGNCRCLGSYSCDAS